MKFAKDTQLRANLHADAETLAEALPWIKEATGKTVVIKYGGSAMEDPELRAKVMSDIVLLKIIGLNPVLVHGGGKAINKAFERYAFPVEFKDGLRVTSPEAMDVVRMVLVGEVNQNLVRDLNEHGNLAVGVSGGDGGTIVARQLAPEYGRVGEIVQVNVEYLNALIEKDYIPVVAGVAQGLDGGYYNINADVAAGAIAGAIGAHKFIALTDVDGVYYDYPNRDSLISNMTRDEARAMVQSGSIDTGMIPKLKSCIDALDAGVMRAHVINGKTPHALLLELLTNTGVGTVIHGTEESYEREMHPLGAFASKLSVNQ
ncbi:MAG: acetylglutamate kinase [Eggerthellaceae bacterium]|uniref:Acetylglutamate kinase n=1 Tax=Denitrobacterium detoxificans TaxID=79604 RepID=A0A172RWT1_9ACTN|nr:acetylglutamate kinase [Denitrobacterium detoxificans]ANE22104.1 acetylglutamate kinase [Denitrobacterium detoxificans]MCR5582988.1 acetylglutamate kinase [Eggerthellaceae bacterium]SEO88798.1 N-acetylglutamate kinase [Denitrobacterium detoxificans]